MRGLISLLLAGAVGAAAVLFNPPHDQHRDRIRQAMAERNPIVGLLGIGVLTAFVSSYQSYGVASVTRVNERVVTVGALGLVWLVPRQ